MTRRTARDSDRDVPWRCSRVRPVRGSGRHAGARPRTHRKAIPAPAGKRPGERPRAGRDAAPPRGKQITLLYSSNGDGDYEQCGCPVHPLGGVARRATVIDRARADADAALVLDGGRSVLAPARKLDADGKRPDAGEIERRARLLAACVRAHRDDRDAAGRARSGARPAAAATAREAGEHLPLLASNLYGARRQAAVRRRQGGRRRRREGRRVRRDGAARARGRRGVQGGRDRRARSGGGGARRGGQPARARRAHRRGDGPRRRRRRQPQAGERACPGSTGPCSGTAA